MSKFQSIKLPKFVKNKFFIAAAAFVIWICFLDKINLMYQYQFRSEELKLEAQKAFFIKEIQQTKEEQQELLSSPEKQEKFAREKYLMKKDEEDLFIIVPSTTAKP
ncbi:septum formation initiator family protein [Chitinophaga silvatica]|uniref:Septum formation initiator family protein n=1 Tax=Chitinophaga silvatica TaxID=2282649 RepID=A0A3E1YC35_9BACT|nr:septum formation initiator family protein [Chitinophaga silvatica]RFS23873.1 septum formation initiator family protein [Chitinophaga silvatica]